MTQPQAYNRETDFTERDGDDTNHAGINTELDAAALSINQLRDNLALIQADDGGLKAGIVKAESLDDSAFDAILVDVNLAVSDAQTAAESANIAALSANAARDQAVTAKENAETANNAAALNAATAALKAAEAASAVAQAVDGEKDLFVAGVGYTKGTTTQLTLAYTPAKSGTVKVFFDGVFQHLTEWSLAGNVITFTAAIPADKVEVHYVIPSQFVGLSNADLEVLGDAQVVAQAGATTATTQAGIAATQAGIATNAKTAAELARDAALIQAGVYTTEAAGRAAVADGVAFKVQGSGDVAAYEYRRTNSTTSVLIATYPSSAYIDTVWQKHTNIVLSNLGLTVSLVSGSTVTFATTGGFYSNGKDDYKTVPALASIALPNVQCIYLDISNLAAITWSAAGSQINVKDSKNKILVFLNMVGKLHSPIPSVQRLIAEAEAVYLTNDPASLKATATANAAIAAAATNALFRQQVQLALTPAGSAANIPVITSIVSSSTTFSVPASFLSTFHVTYKSVPALPSTTLANTQCLYLNIANLDAITWSAAAATVSGGNKPDANRLIAIVNFYGRLYSPIPSLQSALDEAYAAYVNPPAASTTYVERVIAPSGGDYTSVSAALAAITDATANKRYRVHIEPGTYENEAGVNGNGIELKDYIDFEGAGRGRVFIRGVEAISGDEVNKDTIHKLARCTISGVSLLAYKAKYCIHTESNADPSLAFTLRDSDCQHYGGADGYSNDIGLGLYSNQNLTFENVNLLGNGFFMHSQIAARALNTNWTVALRGVTGKTLTVADYMEYTRNKLIIDGCDFERFHYFVSKTYYDANPANTLYNRGYYSLGIDLQFVGRPRIGRVDYGDAFTLSTLACKTIVPGTNARCVNKGTGSIAKGEAVKLLSGPAAVPNAYSLPATAMSMNHVEKWDGSGVFGGFAEGAMAVDGLDAYQFEGRPYALADASGTAIVYGDELELNSFGRVVKKTSGTTRAYALEALASGTGLIVVKLL